MGVAKVCNKALLADAECVNAIKDGKVKRLVDVVKTGGNGTPQYYGRDHLYKIVDCLNKSKHYYVGFYSDSDIFYMGTEKHIDAIYFQSPCDVGSELLVKEPWCSLRGKYYYKAEQKCTGCTEDGTCLPVGVEATEICKLCEDMSGYWKWKGPVTLKREAVRFKLYVTDLKVKRLQDISYQEIAQSGLDLTGKNGSQAKEYYISEWDRKHVLKSDKWESNPWVWVISVENETQPEYRQKGLDTDSADIV